MNNTSPSLNYTNAQLQEAIRLTDQELDNQPQAEQAPQVAAEAPQAAPLEEADEGFLSKAKDVWDSVGAGVGNAAIETKDFLFGEPKQEDKSQFRKDWEAKSTELKEKSTVNSVAMGVSQFTTGMVGLGKLTAPIKAVQKLKGAGKLGHLAYETLRGAGAAATVIDPHEERLSDLVQQYDFLQNPVTEFLASNPDDSAAMGRFKNALEGVGMDLALAGTFVASVKAIKYFREGDEARAIKVLAQEEHTATGLVEEPKADLTANPRTVVPDAEPLGDIKSPNAEPSTNTGKSVPETGTTVPANGEQKVITEEVRTGAPAEDVSQANQPGIFKTADMSDEELATIVAKSDEDTEAIAQYGSREEAIANGYKFAEGPALPWQKLRASDEVMTFMDRTAEVLQARFNGVKGGAILKDERVAELIDERAALYNEDPATIMGELVKAGEGAATMVADMEAAMRIGQRMFNDAGDLSRKISAGNLTEFGGNVELAHAELKARVAAALDMLASGQSILSNSGRSLRRARSEFRIKPEDVARVKNMDPDQIARVVLLADGDPRKIAKLANRTWANRVMDEATWHLTNGLLWLWPTHLVNMTTNAFMLAARPTEKLFGSAALAANPKTWADKGKRAQLSMVSKQALKEYSYTIAALGDGWQAAKEAFMRGDSILNPHNTEFFDGSITGVQSQAIEWPKIENVSDLAKTAYKAATYRNIVGAPTRVLGAQDEFFKTIRYRAAVQARAAIEASERGLTGDEAKKFMQAKMDAAIDADTGQALDSNALREAQTVGFQNELNYETNGFGNLGKSLQTLRKNFTPMAIVLPFIKTPVNVIRYGIKMTPGLNLVQAEFRNDLMGKSGVEAQAHAAGQMAMGSMFMGLAAHLVAYDRFTGGGPQDYETKQELLATGWKPYSVRWQDTTGTTKYFELGRFDPVGMAMGMVADIVNLQRKDPDADYTELVTAATLAVAKNLGDKSFLMNLDSAIRAMTNPEESFGKWAGRTVNGMLPMSSLMRGHNPDPYLRDARGFVDTVMRGIPGLSDKLPISRDLFGDPIERYLGVVDTQDSDLVEAEINRIMLETGKGIGKPDTDFEGLDLRDIRLKDGRTAYERYQELAGRTPIPGAPTLKQYLAQIIRSNDYQDMPDGDGGVAGTRLNTLGKIVSEYRRMAKRVLLSENQEQLQPLIRARQKEAASAFQASRAGRIAKERPGIFDLLDSLGANQL